MNSVSDILFDTLIWTGALIALVLLLRRPVTRWFGAPTAYALWALPVLRLILPPIQLPAWLAPAEAATESATTITITQLDPASPSTTSPVEANSSTMSSGIAGSGSEQAGGDLFATLAGLPLTEIALAAWGAGAAVFLYVRFSAYFRLRHELMEGACEVGSTPGLFRRIRLIETPSTNAPLAFGVLDPVIALPPGFMAQHNREARDLALAHELQHHRGHDLLINVLAQPLFAIHWFNPLGRYGWLAMRRDQEAACDARVIAANPETRGLYADVIASFAAGPNVALAAPMACPVLGDKSIIQRLRNIKMTEQSSNTRRRLTSRLMLGTAILALPLTASISYAESAVQEAQELPAPPAAPEPPTPPSVETPEPPEPPAPPSVEEEESVTIITIDPDDVDGEGDERTTKIEIRTSSDTVQLPNQSFAYVVRGIDEDTKRALRQRYKTVHLINRDDKERQAELEVVLREFREELAEADEELRETRIELKALENEQKLAALGRANVRGRTVIRMSCDDSIEDVATTLDREDGTHEVIICQSRAMSHAIKSLKEARRSIARNSQIQGETRERILEELDEQIESWKEEAR